ncbi:hypothetical protein MHU86_21155 [Fragilaria crotonensis]|nr:hypothetical protein MHU86_21155 [Fragilaria crotonensis]
MHETVLIKIHNQAENWLLNFAQKKYFDGARNLRAGLQNFDAGEVNGMSQGKTYTMQHDPTSLLPELKKLLSYSYRKGLFASRGFDESDEFAVAYFLKDFLLEVPPSVATHPFVVEFCLMFPFRVSAQESKISLISCDTVSSLFSKVASLLKAAVCSVICFFRAVIHPFWRFACVIYSQGSVLHSVTDGSTNTKCMNDYKKAKTMIDSGGNIIVDQHAFPYDIWSRIVPTAVTLMRESLTHLADGSWWEPVVDPSTFIRIRVDDDTADISLLDVTPCWNVGLSFLVDQLDCFMALLKMAFLGKDERVDRTDYVPLRVQQ